MTRLEVYDGLLRVALGPHHTLSSQGVYLKHAEGRYRLVAGATRLARHDAWTAQLESLSMDLGDDLRPRRAAALAGGIRSARHPGAALSLHRLTAEQVLDGYWFEAVGKTVGRQSGRFTVTGQVTHGLRPDLIQGSLHNVDLTALEPALEPLGIISEGSRLSGRVRLEHRRQSYQLDALLSARAIRIKQPVLARRIVGPFDGQLMTSATLAPGQGTLTVHALRLVAGSAVANLKGSLKLAGGHTQLEAELQVPRTSCQDLLASLPEGFAPMLDGMALKGEIGGKARLALNTANLADTTVDVSLRPLRCRVLVDPPLANMRTAKGELTIGVSGPTGRGMEWPLGPSNPDWTPWRGISPHVRAAFIVAEDTRFFDHDGFDPKQLKRAFVSNLEQGRMRRGASTISQQLVKNVFLGHQRTLSRKFQEAVLTWRLEQVVSKHRILELYLNMVEMGPGVYGVAQAARHYFDKDIKELTPLEAVHLAALTPSPRHLGQRFRSGTPGVAWTQKLQMLLRMMRRHGSITLEQQRRWSAATLSLLNR